MPDLDLNIGSAIYFDYVLMIDEPSHGHLSQGLRSAFPQMTGLLTIFLGPIPKAGRIWGEDGVVAVCEEGRSVLLEAFMGALFGGPYLKVACAVWGSDMSSDSVLQWSDPLASRSQP